VTFTGAFDHLGVVSCEVVIVDATIALYRHHLSSGRPRSVKPARGFHPVPDNAGTVRVVDTLSLT